MLQYFFSLYGLLEDCKFSTELATPQILSVAMLWSSWEDTNMWNYEDKCSINTSSRISSAMWSQPTWLLANPRTGHESSPEPCKCNPYWSQHNNKVSAQRCNPSKFSTQWTTKIIDRSTFPSMFNRLLREEPATKTVPYQVANMARTQLAIP